MPSNIELLNHILDEITFTLRSTASRSKAAFENYPILSRAVIRRLEIVGEACSKLDPDSKSLYPHIDWRKMACTRNRLIHDYFGVDYDIMWDIIVTKLPQVGTDVQEIISSLYK